MVVTLRGWDWTIKLSKVCGDGRMGRCLAGATGILENLTTSEEEKIVDLCGPLPVFGMTRLVLTRIDIYVKLITMY